MADAILVLNAGSSSIKFSLFLAQTGELELLLRGQLEGLYTAPRFAAKDAAGASLGAREWDKGTHLGHDGAVDHLIGFLREPWRGLPLDRRRPPGRARRTQVLGADAGQRGGGDKPRKVHSAGTPAPAAQSRADPYRGGTHAAVAAGGVLRHRVSTAPSPSSRRAFALPPSITERGVRRYGFHGLSYEYIASALPRLDARPGAASWCRTWATAPACAPCKAGTASPVPWASPPSTACRWAPAAVSLDPGVILYLMDELEMDVRAIEKTYSNQSGLLGVSGISSDMRTLLASAEPGARLAIDLYVYRIGRELGSFAAALGGLDAHRFHRGHRRACRRPARPRVRRRGLAGCGAGPGG